MKLEDFVKGLKVGEYVKIETTGEKNRVIEIWCDNEGKYDFYVLNYSVEVEELKHAAFETAGELLDYIAKHFADWLEYDFEIYKTRAELKSENAALKKENEDLMAENLAAAKDLAEQSAAAVKAGIDLNAEIAGLEISNENFKKLYSQAFKKGVNM